MTSSSISPAAPISPASRSYSPDDWQGGYRSLKQEFSYWVDDIEGTIPPSLQGTLFRNGPGLLDVNGQQIAHPFDGDGMVSAIAFDQGRAYFQNRFVRTEGYQAEQKVGEIQYRGVFGTQKSGGWFKNLFDLKLKNIANTNVIYWGDKLLALWEAAEPYRLDPYTLDTLALESMNGVLEPGDAFSAHPRIDPGWNADQQPRLVNFSVQPGLSSTITIFEFDPAGALLSQRKHSIPGFAFLHDFAITPNYCIFFQNPIRFNPLPFVLGMRGAAQCLDFQPNQPTRILVIPRRGEAPVQTYETESCFVFHHANAFEDGDRLVIDSICYGFFPKLEPGQDFLQVDFDQYPAGQLNRFQVNPQTAQVTQERLSSRTCEFPVLHPAKVGQKSRYYYMGVTHEPTGNAPLQAIAKVDLQTQSSQIWSAAPRGFVSEPIFVPHPQASDLQVSPDAEDHGWVLTVVYNAETLRSQIVILDAQAIDQGPVAKLNLKHHIPYGLHGSFTPHVFLPVDLA